MKKRMSKGGQEGWTLVNLLLALIVLVVVGLAIWYFVQRASEVGENIPTKVEIIKQACALTTSPQFIDSYCNQIRKIGKNKYVTCDFAVEKEFIAIEDSESMKSLCSDQEKTRKIRILQQAYEQNLKDIVMINSKTKSQWVEAGTP